MAKTKKKNILVTGSTGFLGSFLREELLKNKYRVFGIEKADITQKKSLARYRKILRQADVVIHLAAYVPLTSNADDLQKSISVNLEGTINLVHFLRPKTKFIFASTCEVYSQNDKPDIKENYKTEPTSFYGASKLAAEKYLQVLCKRKNIALLILRFASIYGPKEKISRAIPNFIKASLKQKDIPIFGTGQDKRSFIYVADAAEAMFKAMEYEKEGVFNIASAEKISISNLAKLIKKMSGSESKIVFRASKKPETNIVLNTALAKKELGFEAKTRLRTGLKAEIESFRKTNKKTIVFDLDGTLLENNRRWYSLHLDLSKKYRYRPLPKAEYISLKRSGLAEERIISKTGILAKRIPAYVAERRKIIEQEQYLKKMKVKPGVKKLLEKLRGNYNLVLLTKRRKKRACFGQMEHLAIKEYFSDIIIAGNKPKAEVAQKFLQNSVDKNDIVVGDTKDDYFVAKKLGVKSVLVSDGARDREYLSKLKPSFILSKIQDAIKIL